MSDEKEVVYEDVRTGEIIPAGANEEIAVYKPTNTVQIQVDLAQIGTLELSPETEAILDEPLNPVDVKIRPDGLVYLPWTWYAKRLNRAFGRLKWGIIPQAGAKSVDTPQGVLVVQPFWFVIKGIPVGNATGECTYQPDNRTMSYGDAAEGAKSNALARNCKLLGISLELWDADWVNTWRNKYAEKFTNKRGREEWRKKLAVMPGASQTVTVETSETPMANAATEESGVVVETQYSVTELRTLEVTKKLAKAANVKISQAATFVGTLDESQSYTMAQLAKLLTEAN